MRKQRRFEPRLCLGVVAPDVTQQLAVELLGTAGRQVRPRIAGKHRPAHRAPQAQPPRSFEDDDKIGSRQPQIERLDEIAFADPGFFCEGRGEGGAMRAGQRCPPTRQPVERLKMNHREAEPLPYLPRQG